MSLNFIMGRAGSGKTFHCLDEITIELQSNPQGEALILIVPEQATFALEKKIAILAGAYTRLYVVGFKRLAYQVLQKSGGSLNPHISDLGKKLALKKLLLLNEDKLSILAKASKQPNFTDTLASAIWEFKTYGVTPAALLEANNEVKNHTLKAKINDLGILYSEFENFLAGRYIDPEDTLAMLIEKIPTSSLIEGAKIWVDGFHFFTPQEFRVLGALMQKAANMSVTLTIDIDKVETYEEELSLFRKQYNTFLTLNSLGQKNGLPINTIKIPDTKRFAKALELKHLEEELALGGYLPYEGENKAIRLAEAPNIRMEAEAVARDIIKLCQQRKYRFRDILILVRENETYLPILQNILSDYDIAYFDDQRRSALKHPLAELMMSVLETINSGFMYEPLFRSFKTDLFTSDKDSIDSLENYVLTYGIKGKLWFSEEDWNFRKRMALDEEPINSQSEIIYLKKINNIKNTLRRPLITLNNEISKAYNIKDKTIALYNFLEKLQVNDTLNTWADQAEELGLLKEAREHRQIFDAVIQMLEELVEALGEQNSTLDEYIELIIEGLQGLNLNIIPPSTDQVTISTLERARTMEARAVYILGLNEGVLPARIYEQGLINDNERQELKDFGIDLWPGTQEDMSSEKILIYTAFTRAKEYLWLSYSLADAEGGALEPSFLIKKIKSLCAIKETISLNIDARSKDIFTEIVHPRKAAGLLASSLRAYIKGEKINPEWFEVYNWLLASKTYRKYLVGIIDGLGHYNQEANLPSELARKLYKLEQRSLSITRIEGYKRCPFQHFLKYGLKLKERNIQKLEAMDFGQLYHMMMKGIGEEIARKGYDWTTFPEEEIPVLCNEVLAAYAPNLQNEILLSNAQYEHIKGRIKDTIITVVKHQKNFAQVSKLRPIYYEQSFGAEKGWDAYALDLEDGNKITLTGQIDRIDILKHNEEVYVAIIDYKSGGQWFKLNEVYHGHKLQLITYLMVALNNLPTILNVEQVHPAGILYSFLKNPIINEANFTEVPKLKESIKKELQMPCWIIDNPDIAADIDNTAMGGWAKYLKGVYISQKGFHKSSLDKAKSAKEFEAITTLVKNILKSAATEILNGEITIKPAAVSGKAEPCQYCQYKKVCQFDELLPENELINLPTKSDEEVLAEIMPTERGDGHEVV